MLGDTVRVYRVRNMVKTVQKTERILRDAGLTPNAVPPRLLLPIVENSSVEDDDSLQELWAGLLATASQQTDSVSPSFIETLKQLTPDEARHFEHIYKTIQGAGNQRSGANRPITPYAFTERWGTPHGVTAETFERLGLIRRDFDVKLRSNLNSLNRNINSVNDALHAVEKAVDSIEPEMRYQFIFTDYAVNFLEACHGPRAASVQSS